MVNATPRSLCQERHPIPVVKEAGWALGPALTSAENVTPTGVRSPDRRAGSESLY